MARYQGRTLEAYRHDLSGFSQRARDVGLDVLAATRPQIEPYVRRLEEAGLAPSTIDRRISTVCGFYRFAHIDGVIASNPAQYVRHPSQARGLDRGDLAAFLLTAERCDHARATVAVLLGLNGLSVSEACSADVEDLGFERGPPHPADHWQGGQARHDPAFSPHGPDGGSGGRRLRHRRVTLRRLRG